MLTQRMQIQVVAGVIAELLRGPDARPPKGPFLCGRDGVRRMRAYREEDFMEPYGRVWAALEELRPTVAGKDYNRRFDGVNRTLRRVLAQYEDGDSIYITIGSSAAGYAPELFPLSSELLATYQPPAWLWEGWLPMGMLSLLGAAPGAGKTYVAFDLARRIVAGDVFPDGSPVPAGLAGDEVLYVDAEGIPGALLQRLQAWDMDIDRLHLLLPGGDGLVDFGRQDDRDRFTEMLAAYEPALAVIDSLSMITSRGENSVEDVREVLAFLRMRAADYGCAILLLHHTRKRHPLLAGQELTMDDLRGSSHIIGQARSVLGLSLVQEGPDPDPNGPRRLEVIKANFGQTPPALGLRMEPIDKMCARLVYGPPPQKYTELQQPREACAAWLVELLGDHPEGMRPGEIIDLAHAARHSRSAVYRARDLLGRRLECTGDRRHQIWRLAGDRLS